MQSFSIVEHFDVTKDFLFGLLVRRWNPATEVVEAFGFEGRSKAFHQGIVVAIGFAAHALGDTVDPQKVPNYFAGILAAAIRVMNRSVGVIMDKVVMVVRVRVSQSAPGGSYHQR